MIPSIFRQVKSRANNIKVIIISYRFYVTLFLDAEGTTFLYWLFLTCDRFSAFSYSGKRHRKRERPSGCNTKSVHVAMAAVICFDDICLTGTIPTGCVPLDP